METTIKVGNDYILVQTVSKGAYLYSVPSIGYIFETFEEAKAAIEGLQDTCHDFSEAK